MTKRKTKDLLADERLHAELDLDRKADTPKQNNVVVVQKALTEFLQKNGDRIGYLRCRWQDEKEYENFSDYAKEMRKLTAKSPFKFVRATKSPFGFTMTHPSVSFAVQVTANSRTVEVKECRR